MKLFAVKVKRSLGVPTDPQARFSCMIKDYEPGEHAVFTEDQFKLYGKDDVELICEVKKPSGRKKGANKKESTSKEGV